MSGQRYLLDVSTLVALVWKGHSEHAKATAWSAGKRLAVCPITELGFLRVVTSAAYNASMAQARTVLHDFLERENPDFVPADLRALSGPAAPSSGKTTDWYLANLAKSHGLIWATLDTGAKHPNAEFIV